VPQAAEPVSWAGSTAARCRRLDEQIRRLPHVNGTHALITLSLSSALSAPMGSRHERPR
jgi:hypothetical protein